MVLTVVGLALLPAMVAAAPPTPKGQLVYEDDFTSGEKSGLEDNVNAADFQRGFHPPGVYHLRVTNPNEVRFSLLPNQSYGQFSAEAEVWDNSDAFQGDVAQGLVFRAQDDAHLYAVLLHPRKGQYSVRKLDGGEWSDLVAAADSPLVQGQSNVNMLRVDAEGSDFTIYLNGETLTSFSDASYAKGGLGMIIANVDAVEPHMHFDNLAIYSTEAVPAAATPGALPRSGAAASLPLLALAILAALLLVGGASVRRAGR
jgi:hypothetical protein